MLKQLMLLTTASLISVTGSVQAQTQSTGLSSDFELTGNTIVLPLDMLASAGYPQWRLVTMNGQNAVPYNYCSWLINQKPWVTKVFGDSRWQAVEQCAEGISAVTQAQVDNSLPLGTDSAEFWRNRPEGYQYLVPDYDLTEAQFIALMGEPILEEVTFVTNPELLATYLADKLQRLEALEDWRQSLTDDGGVVTEDWLENWAREAELLTVEQARELLDERLPEGDILTQEEIESLIQTVVDALPVVVLPEGLLTQDMADDLYLVKGGEVGGKPFLFSYPWWWLFFLTLLTLICLGVWAWLYPKVTKARQRADDAMDRADEAHSGLEAQIELDAKGRLGAPGFTNEKLKHLGDQPFELLMPGIGVARKKVCVYNRGDHLELFGMAKGHDRVDKISVVAVYRHLAKALREENDWITGVTIQKAS